jgi:hypothetical protein
MGPQAGWNSEESAFPFARNLKRNRFASAKAQGEFHDHSDTEKGNQEIKDHETTNYRRVNLVRDDLRSGR